MIRNLAALLLVSTILFNNNKLNRVECIILIFLMVCYFIGNITFYLLNIFPSNKFLHFLIYGGQTWHEFPVTFSIMVIFLIYLVLTRKISKK